MTMSSQFGIQALGVVATVVWSTIATVAIVFVVRPIFGLRATDIEIEDGLDLTQHGERAHSP
jgi:Amt family ammonium transporter